MGHFIHQVKQWWTVFNHSFKPYLVAILCFLVICIFQNIINDKVFSVIAGVFEKPIYWAIDAFSVIVIGCLGFFIYRSYQNRSLLQDKVISFLIFLSLLYFYYGFFDDDYSFIGFWENCPIGLVGCLETETLLLIAVSIRNEFAFIRTLSDEENNAGGSYLKDTEIENIAEDKLNVSAYLNKVFEYLKGTICTYDNFSFAVTGKWGEGKSSFVNLLIEKIYNSSIENHKTVIIKFNPRESSDIKQIPVDLLGKLRNSLSDMHTSFASLLENYSNLITVGDDVHPFFKWVRLATIDDIESIKVDIENIIDSLKIKVIIFIDDLDRLTAPEILEVLKLIDKNAAFRNVYFVTAFDKEYVNNALSHSLGLKENENFIDKYFNVEINVPAQPFNILTNFFVGQFEPFVNNHIISKGFIEGIITRYYEILHDILPTIRDMKRFCNMFLFEYTIVKEDVTFEDFFLLTLIQYKYPKEYRALREKEYVNDFNLFRGDSELIMLKKDLFNKDETYSSNAQHCMPILTNLFPTDSTKSSWYSKRDNRICNKVSFDVYFAHYANEGVYRRDLIRIFNGGFNKSVRLLDTLLNHADAVDSFLLTRDISTFSKREVTQYFQAILYCYYKNANLNYFIALSRFVIKSFANDIMKTIKIAKLNDYKKYLNAVFKLVYAVNPLVLNNFINKLYHDSLRWDYDEEQMVFDRGDLHILCRKMYDKYMSKIYSPDWKPTVAFWLSQIPEDKKLESENAISKMDSSVASNLKSNMLDHPEIFSSILIHHLMSLDGNVVLAFMPSFMWKKVFTPKTEFDNFIEALNKSSASQLDKDLCSRFWEAMKGNGYKYPDVDLDDNTPQGDYNAYLDALGKNN